MTSSIILSHPTTTTKARAMEALKESLEEGLVEHDSRREEVQKKIKKRGARALGDVDLLEGRISGEISRTFGKTEEEVSALIDKLANREWAGDKEMKSIMEQAQETLSSEPKAEIQHSGSGEGFASSYQLEIISVKKEMNLGPIAAADDDEVAEHFPDLLLVGELSFDGDLNVMGLNFFLALLGGARVLDGLGRLSRRIDERLAIVNN